MSDHPGPLLLSLASSAQLHTPLLSGVLREQATLLAPLRRGHGAGLVRALEAYPISRRSRCASITTLQSDLAEVGGAGVGCSLALSLQLTRASNTFSEEQELAYSAISEWRHALSPLFQSMALTQTLVRALIARPDPPSLITIERAPWCVNAARLDDEQRDELAALCAAWDETLALLNAPPHQDGPPPCALVWLPDETMLLYLDESLRDLRAADTRAQCLAELERVDPLCGEDWRHVSRRGFLNALLGGHPARSIAWTQRTSPDLIGLYIKQHPEASARPMFVCGPPQRSETVDLIAAEVVSWTLRSDALLLTQRLGQHRLSRAMPALSHQLRALRTQYTQGDP